MGRQGWGLGRRTAHPDCRQDTHVDGERRSRERNAGRPSLELVTWFLEGLGKQPKNSCYGRYLVNSAQILRCPVGSDSNTTLWYLCTVTAHFFHTAGDVFLLLNTVEHLQRM